MVRWRYSLVLALLLLRCCGSKLEEDDEDERSSEETEDEDEDDEEDEEEEHVTQEKAHPPMNRRPPPQRVVLQTLQTQPTVTRTTRGRPLECYVCAYKAETPLRACLDPAKYRVHVITCQNHEDRCFTSAITQGNVYEAVVRGCRSACVSSSDTTCCESHRCNNQAFALPVTLPHQMVSQKSKASKLWQPNVLFFVTILLLLQTVGKVSFS